MALIVHKSLAILILALGVHLCSAQQNPAWISMNGPWIAEDVKEMAVGRGLNTHSIYAVHRPSTTHRWRLIKSTDNGESWNVVFDNPLFDVYSVATPENNSDVVLIGLNIHDNPASAILRSNNGGQNWSSTSGTGGAPPVRKISFFQADPTIVAASFAGDQNVQPGILLSGDGGVNWFFPVETPITVITDIVFHPTNFSTIFISGYNPFQVPPWNEGIWKTTNLGGTWVEKTQGMTSKNIASIAISPDQPDVLLSGTMAPYGDPLLDDEGLWAHFETQPFVYKTIVGGEGWYVAENSYVTDMIIDPTNSSTAFFSSLSNEVGIFRSTDQGENWKASDKDIYDKRVLSLVSETTSPGTFFAGSRRCIYISGNTGDTWRDVPSGIEKAPSVSVSISSNLVVAAGGVLGGEILGTIHRTTNMGQLWQITFPNNELDADRFTWGDVRFHPTNGSLLFVCGKWGDVDIGSIRRSTDSGYSWSTVLFDLEQTYFSSLDFDINDNSVVFAIGTTSSGAILAKSIDAGTSWTYRYPGMVSGSAIAVDPTTTGSNRIVYVVGSSVKKSINDGAGWTDASAGMGSAVAITINPTTPSILFGGNVNGVYKTVNSAQSWVQANNGLLHHNVTSLLVHPKTPDVVYAATMEGSIKAHLYESVNNGDSWSEVGMNSLPSNAWVYRLTVDQNDPNRIFAATDSGVYSITHTWTGLITTNTTWKSGQTYLVEGTLTVAAGKTLTILPNTTVQFLANSGLKVQGTLVVEGTLTIPSGITFTADPGAQIKFLPNGYLQITGPLKAKGTSASPITFTRNGTTGTWSGLKFIGASIRSDTIEYAKFSYSNPALDLQAKNTLRLANTTFDNCNIGVQMIQTAGDMYREIKNCRFTNISGTGISISNLSNILIDTDTINCISGAKGIFLDGSSPQILRTRVYDGVPGIECVNFSAPVLEDGINGGYNKFKGASGAFRCSNGSDAIFGFISGALGDVGGLNSFEITNYAIGTETGASIVLAESCWWGQKTDPGQRLLADDESSIDYVPWKLNNPNPGASILLSNDGGSPVLTPGEVLMREVVQYRSEGQFVQALQAIKVMIASEAVTSQFKKWAVRQLVAIAHRLPGERLSGYIGTLLNTQPGLLRQLRGMHPNILLGEGSVSDAQERFNANIQQYPYSELECAALYGKFLHALYTANNIDAATALKYALTTRYAESGEAFMAALQLENGLHISSESQRMQLKVAADVNSTPILFSLEQNYPNPFNPTTTISYRVPVDIHVTLNVYDVLGRQVVSLVDENISAGRHSVTLDGGSLATGLYFYRLTAGSFSETKKLLLAK